MSGFVDTNVGAAPSQYSEYTPNNPSLQLSSLGAGATAPPVSFSDNFTPILASAGIAHNYQPEQQEAVLLDLDQEHSVIDFEGDSSIFLTGILDSGFVQDIHQVSGRYHRC